MKSAVHVMLPVSETHRRPRSLPSKQNPSTPHSVVKYLRTLRSHLLYPPHRPLFLSSESLLSAAKLRICCLLTCSMGLLHQLWDDTVAGPPPENGLGKLRKFAGFRPNSGKDLDVARSYGGDSAEDAIRVTRSIMIVKPPGYRGVTPPASPSEVSPAGSTPPVSPFSGPGKESFRFRRRSTSDAFEKASNRSSSPSSPFDV